MRFIVRKMVDAESVKEALEKEPTTPVHEVFLKEGEEPKSSSVHAVGFTMETDPYWRPDEIRARRGK